jgi:hypothetical protein
MKLAHEDSRKRKDDGGAPCGSAAWAWGYIVAWATARAGGREVAVVTGREAEAATEPVDGEVRTR